MPQRDRIGVFLFRIGALLVGLIVSVTVYNLLMAGRRVGRGQVDVILAKADTDDAVASLTMLLRHHGKAVTTAAVAAALYPDGPKTPTALDVVQAAERLGMAGRGVRLDSVEELGLLPLPCIGLIFEKEAPFPRPLAEHGAGGRFVLIERVAMERQLVSLVDPMGGGRKIMPIARFAPRSGDVFLLFEADRAPAR